MPESTWWSAADSQRRKRSRGSPGGGSKSGSETHRDRPRCRRRSERRIGLVSRKDSDPPRWAEIGKGDSKSGVPTGACEFESRPRHWEGPPDRSESAPCDAPANVVGPAPRRRQMKRAIRPAGLALLALALGAAAPAPDVRAAPLRTVSHGDAARPSGRFERSPRPGARRSGHGLRGRIRRDELSRRLDRRPRGCPDGVRRSRHSRRHRAR